MFFGKVFVPSTWRPILKCNDILIVFSGIIYVWNFCPRDLSSPLPACCKWPCPRKTENSGVSISPMLRAVTGFFVAPSGNEPICVVQNRAKRMWPVCKSRATSDQDFWNDCALSFYDLPALENWNPFTDDNDKVLTRITRAYTPCPT